ncbi:hypothetical protein EDC40_103679 [Aminobacter aminovorans]|uniref:Uncharacterized protein n=1 Tax=Aminobacter aminovorans TaxID=83263 RepID=A0A380WK39_AMIAI|nr:hypothetical protein EDC40_103679 [Aminobacter aminovorans]SUU89379.1 Uncharacterised protein [Aminobacter aminovorans]
MTLLAISLYALGVVAGLAAIHTEGADGRNKPARLGEWVVVIGWPVSVSATIGFVAFRFVRTGWRP